MQLTDEQVLSYRQNGYLLLHDLVPEKALTEIRRVTRRLVEDSRSVAVSNDDYDVDLAHRADAPRVRRIKDPHRQDRAFLRLSRSDEILDPVSQLLGGTARFDHSKLNFKHRDGDAQIHWHQDWAFYPHTNDDLLEIGVMIEDCTPASGPLRVIPGSHRGPVYDHHHRGVFVGSISDDEIAPVIPTAVDLFGPAGSLTIHHVRTLHASANCTADTNRPLLLFGYSAVDAFPVFGMPDLAEFDGRILRGNPVRAGRMESLPIRLPLPLPSGPASIYNTQAAREATL